MDNFRKPKRPNKHGAIDGFIVNPRNKRAGSINFDRGTPHARVRTVTKRLDDFSRPEGFTAATQPVVSVDHPMPDLQAGPRRRSQLEVAAPAISTPRRKDRKDKKEKKPKSLKRKIIKRSFLTLLVLALIVSGFLGWKVFKNTSKVLQGNFFGLLSNSTKLKGEDKGRVNILLVGTSEDDPGHSGANLTDSIMVISLDTVNNTGFTMSIPRDLWVNYGTNSCPFGNSGKINAVYECGEMVKFQESGYPSGGLGLLEKDIKRDFGLDINYYAKIDYGAFKEAVNAVGGIDITIKTNDPRGLYDGNISKADKGPLKLANGLQHLDGQTALNLARARCDTVCYGFTRGDFDRTEHQRQMLLALKDKAFSAGVISNPGKVSSLLDAAGNNVKTDFKTNEVRRLIEIAKLIKNEQIQSIGLADTNVNLVQTATIGNSSAVRPVAGQSDFSQIKAFIKRLTSGDPVAKEGASAVVLNGSGIAGLAQNRANDLIQKGITVKAVANAKVRPATAIIIMKTDKPATKKYLEQKFNVTVTTDIAANPEAANYQADFVIILGQNATNTTAH